MKTLIFSILLISGLAQAQNCIPANEYIPFAGEAAKPNKDGSVALGMYARISPEGKYILRSLSGDNLTNATVMEIVTAEEGKKVALARETSLGMESYPVQGTWRFLNDVGGNHYMLRDILQKGKSASSQFRGGVTGFYAAAGELPSDNPSEIKIRSLAWPTEGNGTGQLKNVLITVSKRGGGYEKVASTSDSWMCRNIRATEGDVFSLPMISVNGMEFTGMPQYPEDKKPTLRVYEFSQKNNEDCAKVDDLGVAAAKAIFGFQPGPGKKAPVVYLGASSFLTNEPNCFMVSEDWLPDEKNPAIKYPVKLDPPQRRCEGFIRTNVTGIHWYERNVKKTFYVGDRYKQVSADSFPGATKDGRVVYGATWSEPRTVKRMMKVAYPMRNDAGSIMLDNKGMQMFDYKEELKDVTIQVKVTGYVISDPYQSEDVKNFRKREPARANDLKKCITKEEVAAVEASQRAIYGM